MFLRILTFKNKKGGAKRQYLQIVKSIRDGKKVRQKLIANLGRLDILEGRKKIINLVDKLVKFFPESGKKSLKKWR